MTEVTFTRSILCGSRHSTQCHMGLSAASMAHGILRYETIKNFAQVYSCSFRSCLNIAVIPVPIAGVSDERWLSYDLRHFSFFFWVRAQYIPVLNGLCYVAGRHHEYSKCILWRSYILKFRMSLLLPLGSEWLPKKLPRKKSSSNRLIFTWFSKNLKFHRSLHYLCTAQKGTNSHKASGLRMFHAFPFLCFFHPFG